MKNAMLIPGAVCALLTCMLTSGCKKQVSTAPQLPPATHVGADIVACKVNGQIIISKGAGGKFSQFDPGVMYGVSGGPYDSSAIIFATASGNLPFTLEVCSKYKFALGTYKIERTPYSSGAYFNSFVTDSVHGGYITYTYYDGNILAGTFYFDAVDANDSVIHVTEGVFDIDNH